MVQLSKSAGIGSNVDEPQKNNIKQNKDTKKGHILGLQRLFSSQKRWLAILAVCLVEVPSTNKAVHNPV